MRRKNSDHPQRVVEGLDGLGREGSAVLAVLVLAGLWPGRFVDGWVSDLDFGNCSRDLPKPQKTRGTWRDTLKREIRLGLVELRSILPRESVARERVANVADLSDPREKATRLTTLPSPELEDWFYRHGLDCLDLDTRRTFRMNTYGLLGTRSAYVAALEEGIVYRLIDSGDFQGAKRCANEALARATTPYERRIFTLALANADLAAVASDLSNWWDNLPLAIDALRPLANTDDDYTTIPERTLQARILVTLARCLSLRAWAHPREDTELECLAEARRHLESARHLAYDASHLDRGDLSFAEATVEEVTGLIALNDNNDREGAEHHFGKAELLTLSAFVSWHRVQRWDRIRDGIDHLIDSQINIKLRFLDAERGQLLLPWLLAVVRFWDAVSQEPLAERPRLYETVLEVFNALPSEIPPEALPLPTRACHDVVARCIAAVRADERFYGHSPQSIAVEDAAWYRSEAEQLKRKPGASD